MVRKGKEKKGSAYHRVEFGLWVCSFVCFQKRHGIALVMLVLVCKVFLKGPW